MILVSVLVKTEKKVLDPASGGTRILAPREAELDEKRAPLCSVNEEARPAASWTTAVRQTSGLEPVPKAEPREGRRSNCGEGADLFPIKVLDDTILCQLSLLGLL